MTSIRTSPTWCRENEKPGNAVSQDETIVSFVNAATRMLGIKIMNDSSRENSLLLHSGCCSNAYDTKLGSHTYDILPVAATETIVYGHRSSGTTNFWF